MGKSSSGTTKSSTPESRTSSKTHNNDSNGRPRGMSRRNLSNKRESPSMDAIRDEERCERPKKILKETPKSSVGSESKTLQSTKLSHALVKKIISEAKDSVPNSFAKTSIVHSDPTSSRSAESYTSPQSESATYIHNKATALSDEELALLLHQELNSSPRVYRVPQICHASILPQLTFPTSTSMIMKRTSSGGKNHGLTFRRKSKEIGKYGSKCS
ncbi:hypothetical protein K7X08_038073 [Anisodus acutangulus]|uniref:Uncharacterized protein n=1 Tax=Anisodus acutangulus TaxID=402998 RepID=A0A9Q1MXT7_9SOLA|nr:hypothetical protein K7X08_038073 [Anisodus acutangulus]